ncbi:MAG: hypothetical protein AAF485_13640 [Chloroflexota bacterium]
MSAEGDGRKQVIVNTSMFALYGNHIYVTIQGDGKSLEYRARNPLDAKSFIERALQRYFADDTYDIIQDGDIVVHFVYHRPGD